MGSLGFTLVHLGSLGFTWVHLGSLGQFQSYWRLLIHTYIRTFFLCIEILSDLIIVSSLICVTDLALALLPPPLQPPANPQGEVTLQLGLWIRGHLIMWTRDHLIMWTRGYKGKRLCGFVHKRSSGHVDERSQGQEVLWTCGQEVRSGTCLVLRIRGQVSTESADAMAINRAKVILYQFFPSLSSTLVFLFLPCPS